VRRGPGGRRLYDEDDVEWLTVCIILRAAGMPLPALRRYADLVSEGAGNEEERLALLREHREHETAQIRRLGECLDLIGFKIVVSRVGTVDAAVPADNHVRAGQAACEWVSRHLARAKEQHWPGGVSCVESEDAGRVDEPGLVDVVAEGLAVIFVGINPGLASVAHGHNFATPSNRFWPALHRSGFTPRLMRAEKEGELLGLRLGITSIVRRPTTRAAQLSLREIVTGGRDLAERARMLRPEWLAMLGVTGYRAAFGIGQAGLGLQAEMVGSARVWVLPNPSGLNAHYPPNELAIEFAKLRIATGLPDRSGVLGNGPFAGPSL
jgi:TDG/mug DNA glycosylase family protein